jgi:hypothetical protein
MKYPLVLISALAMSSANAETCDLPPAGLIAAQALEQYQDKVKGCFPNNLPCGQAGQ